MGPTWGREDPGGPHIIPMNLAIWDSLPEAAARNLLYKVSSVANTSFALDIQWLDSYAAKRGAWLPN